MAKSTKKAVSGMVPHLINFKPSDWEDAKTATKLSGTDDVSTFIREAVRKAARAELRKAGKAPASG